LGLLAVFITVFESLLVAWHNGRTLIFDQRTFSVLR